ncbi:CAAX prenyl protease-related protein [Desulfatitalea tepidiphila]|uniref:CAAX prenyl protease-related protein n=1 Tax=Desulfatitalea tepidiphila TaxID=1185843 RepID=UPI0006B543DC|nr:CAAX prenyl protease-related protein [Desulfatitalea tepidiphila]
MQAFKHSGNGNYDRIISKKNPKYLIEKPWIPYAMPFILFLLLTAPAKYFPIYTPYFYITKTILVAYLLWHWRHAFSADISLRIKPAEYLLSIAAGLVVLVLWITPEDILPKIGTPSGFNPYAFQWPAAATVGLIAVRLAGASIVVPIMEELFWRSFIMRYAINPDFRKVPLGTFSLFSFAAVVILFGLEHYRVIQGIIAGIIYTLLVIRQKSLRGCILAHGVTNLGLGIYVLSTEEWLFW